MGVSFSVWGLRFLVLPPFFHPPSFFLVVLIFDFFSFPFLLFLDFFFFDFFFVFLYSFWVASGFTFSLWLFPWVGGWWCFFHLVACLTLK